MTDFQGMVREWNALIGDKLPDRPTAPSAETRQLYARLKFEESLEWAAAAGCEVRANGVAINPRDFEVVVVGAGDLSAMVHENVDCLYIDFNVMNHLGVRADAPFIAVHLANMQKCPGGFCTFVGGKVVKPAGWRPVDMATVLALAGARP
jgi:predicted HAD superfamily Cof-like phosphohydrolase